MINHYVIYYTLDIISYIILVGVFGKMLKERTTATLKNTCIIIILAIVNSLASIDNLLLIKTILALSSFYSICHFIYYKDPKKSLITTLIYFIITLLSELVIMILLTLLNKINMDYITSMDVLKAIITVTSVLVSYLLVSIKPINNMINKGIDFFENKNQYIRIFVIIISCVTGICIFYVINYSYHNSLIMNLLFASICIITVILILNAIHINNKLIVLNNVLSDNEETYNKIIENYKVFKHNIMHEFNCIKSVGNKKVNELINEYINESISEENYNLDLSTVPKGLRIIIYKCIIKHDFYNIDIKVNSFIKTDPISLLQSKKYCMLSQALGILLDNALEASNNIDNSYVYIVMSEDNEKYSFKIINRFSNEINIDNNDYKTTKKNHLGVGLKYIRNSKINIKTLIRNDRYMVLFTINK